MMEMNFESFVKKIDEGLIKTHNIDRTIRDINRTLESYLKVGNDSDTSLSFSDHIPKFRFNIFLNHLGILRNQFN